MPALALGMMGRRDKKRRAAYHRKARLETTESVPPLNQEFAHELAEAVEARPHEDPEILGNEEKVLEFVTCENSPLESGYAGYALRVCSEWEREFYGDADWDSLEEAKTCREASY